MAMPKYSEVRALPTLLNMPIDDSMTAAAILVDGAQDTGSESEVKHAIRVIDELRAASVAKSHSAELSYFAVNAWGALRAIRHRGKPSEWQWRQPEIEQGLLALRTAANSEGFAALPRGRRTQILTNMGSLLNTIGRPLDAIAAYDEALRHFPNFGMAMVNRAVALKTLADAHYNTDQSAVLLHAAFYSIIQAPREHLEPGAYESSQEHAHRIATRLPLGFISKPLSIPPANLGRSKRERDYRRWALRNRLFLNPLVVLGDATLGAKDTLNLPSLVTGIHDGPGLVGMFTQIKQEYVTARFLAWEGSDEDHRPHFSDRQTHLTDTLDYAVYGLAIEKLKSAFRMAYSILDKCAFFLNKYHSLGLEDQDVTLGRVWFVKGNFKKGLNPMVVDTPNLPLRGLFWLARDVYDPQTFRDSLELDSRDLKDLRNHLEHKYLKVHDFLLPDASSLSGLRDQYAKSVLRESLEAKTMTILRLACSAVTCLSLGVHREERRRAKERGSGAIVPPMFLPTIQDRSKT